MVLSALLARLRRTEVYYPRGSSLCGGGRVVIVTRNILTARMAGSSGIFGGAWFSFAEGGATIVSSFTSLPRKTMYS